MKVTPICPALAAEVTGVDIGAGAYDGAAIVEALEQHLVLVFPGQSPSAESQVRFTELFGEPLVHPLRTRRSVTGHDEVLILENREGRPGARNDYWHSDISHMPAPPSVSILYGFKVPSGRGDTMFCNMVRGYETLSDGLRSAMGDLRAFHSAQASADRNNAGNNDGLPITSIPKPSLHPVVRTHPTSGRKALFVNPHFTTHLEDMSEAESRALLEPLYAHATREENIYRHAWRQGDIVIWDNRCTMHYAVRDYTEGDERLMYRTTASGEVPA